MSETESQFAPLFANAFGFNNFGESSRELNKQLIEDIEKERSDNDGKNKTFRKNPCGWQSVAGIENKYERTGELPPGWEKKLTVGKRLDRDLYGHARVVVPLDNDGLITVRIENKVVRLIQATREIVEILD